MKTDHIIFGTHGIRTGAENWADKFRRHNEEFRPSISVEEYDYGCILGVQMYLYGTIPILGWNMMDSYYRWIKQTIREYPIGTPYSIVSHSFGTWLTHGMLYRHRDIKPKANVLIGSVLSEYYAKTRFPIIFTRKQIDRILVMYSPEDKIIADLSNFPFGKNGSRGFIDTVPSDVVQLKYEGGHSDYFSEKTRATNFEIINDFCMEKQNL